MLEKAITILSFLKKGDWDFLSLEWPLCIGCSFFSANSHIMELDEPSHIVLCPFGHACRQGGADCVTGCGSEAAPRRASTCLSPAGWESWWTRPVMKASAEMAGWAEM